MSSGGNACCITGCKNSQWKLTLWKKEQCNIHPGWKRADCPCLIPLSFHRIPKNPKLNELWLHTINQNNLHQRKNILVCSKHFVDGMPTTENPVPQLFLASNNSQGNSSVLESTERNTTEYFSNVMKIQSDIGNISYGEPSTVTQNEYIIPDCDEISKNSVLYFETVNIPVDDDINTYHQKQTIPMDESSTSSSFDFETDQLPIDNINKEHPQMKNAETQTDFASFSAYDLNNSSCKFYTGLNLLFFWKLVQCLQHNGTENFIIPTADQILMVLMRLKLGLLLEDIGRRFGLSKFFVASVICFWLPKMENTLSDLIFWLPRDEIKKCSPKSFKAEFPDTTCVIGCSNIIYKNKIEIKPKKKYHRKYIHSLPGKYLLALSPHGFIMFVSKLYHWKTANKLMICDSGILNDIVPEDEILADRKYSVKHELAMKNVVMKYPSTKKKKLQSNEIPSARLVRFFIQKTLKRMTTFHLIKKPLPSKRSRAERLIKVVAGLCNLKSSLDRSTFVSL